MSKTRKFLERFWIWDFEIGNSLKGFTMLEMVVMLAIVTAISAIVLVSFTGLNEGGALNRASREMALAARKGQNMSLAVTQISVGSPVPTPQIPPAIGLSFSTANPSQYILFADLGTPPNNKFDSELGEQIPNGIGTFERNIKIISLKDQNQQSYPVIHVLFSAPEAAISITDQTGTPIATEKIDVEIAAPSGTKRVITIRSNGQVNWR